MVPVALLVPIPVRRDVVVMIMVANVAAWVIVPMTGVVPVMEAVMAVMPMDAAAIAAPISAAVAEVDPRSLVEAAMAAVM